jgi:hypothetical protein
MLIGLAPNFLSCRVKDSLLKMTFRFKQRAEVDPFYFIFVGCASEWQSVTDFVSNGEKYGLRSTVACCVWGDIPVEFSAFDIGDTPSR